MTKPLLKPIVLLLVLVLTASAAPASQPEREVLSDAELLETMVRDGGLQDPREGLATYYAARFIGRRTTSGAPYHPDRFTAAHATLPLHSVVQVFSRATGQGVQVTINDRCRKRPFQLIDLSRAAARRIGLWGKGAMKVLIIPQTGNQMDELLAELEG